MMDARFQGYDATGRVAAGLATTIGAVVLGAILAWRAFVQGHADLLVLVVGAIALGVAQILIIMKNRGRPALTISQEALVYSPRHAIGRRRVGRDEVVGVAWSTRWCVVLERRAGGLVGGLRRYLPIFLWYLPASQRDEARAAIERWVDESTRERT